MKTGRNADGLHAFAAPGCVSRLLELVAVVVLLAALGLVAPVRASADGGEPRWHVKSALELGHTDNVKWAADGPDKEAADFLTLMGRVGWKPRSARYVPTRIAAGVRARFYDQFSDRNWVEIQPEAFYDFRRSLLRFRYGYTPERLRLDEDPTLGDVFASRHLGSVMAERKFGAGKKWRLRLEIEGEWDISKSSADDRDSFTPAGSGELRWRLHRLFTPRVGIAYGERDAKDANYDRDELELAAGFDSRPVEWCRLRLRYERKHRDYTVSDASGPDGSNSNFDRDDDIDEVESVIELPVSAIRGLSVELRHKYRHSQSTKSSRDFDVHETTVRFVYELP
jgi:hypothetical protein